MPTSTEMPATATATATATASATATATGMAATATATAADLAPIGPSPAIPEKFWHKNRLQEFALRRYKKLPIYNVEVEGEFHKPKFRCTVDVDGQQFSSTGRFNRRKDAEQDAARVAYEILVTSGEGDVKELFELIDQDVMFCRSILHEFAVKTNNPLPTYSIVRLEKPMILFVASLVFDGNTCTGEPAGNMKDAKQKAARAVIKSILAADNTCMMGIIRSKKELITAVRSSGSGSNPNTFSPIKFTRPVAYAAYGVRDHVAPESQNESSLLTAVHGHNIVPAVEPPANPPAKAITGSKKRKGRVDAPGGRH